MFVFGEVQDPNSETVNLVEDIVRGQIIELVIISSVTLVYENNSRRRSSKHAPSPRDAVRATSPRRT
jgi:hypothetical protein